MITIKLFGELATRFTSEFKAHVRTTHEAVECLCINFPGFREYLLNADERGIQFKALIGDNWYLTNEKPEEIFLPIPKDEICITPVVAGSGRTAMIIAGVVLLAAGGLGVGVLAMSAFQTALLGGLLIIQGLFGAQTEAPDPEEDSTKSYIFNGPTNTIAQGNRIPIIWGSLQVGSQVISASVTAYQVSPRRMTKSNN